MSADVCLCAFKRTAVQESAEVNAPWIITASVKPQETNKSTVGNILCSGGGLGVVWQGNDIIK